MCPSWKRMHTHMQMHMHSHTHICTYAHAQYVCMCAKKDIRRLSIWGGSNPETCPFSGNKLISNGLKRNNMILHTCLLSFSPEMLQSEYLSSLPAHVFGLDLLSHLIGPAYENRAQSYDGPCTCIQQHIYIISYIRNFGPKTRVFYTLVIFIRFLSVKSGGPNATCFASGSPLMYIYTYIHIVYLSPLSV